MLESTHQKCLELYKKYLIVGGMPNNVKRFVELDGDYIKFNDEILTNIKTDYINDMKKHVDSITDTLKLEKTYFSLPSQLSNLSKKFQYAKIEKGARKSQYELTIDWLIASNLIVKSRLVSTPQIPLEGFVENDYFKLFLSDVGILNNMLGIKINDILKDNLSLYKGAITENFVANQLVQNGYLLYYWKNNATAEIDFLIYSNGNVIPIEVKTSTHNHSPSLDLYMKRFNPIYAIRISAKNFGYNKDKKIKSVPLYAVFCITE